MPEIIEYRRGVALGALHASDVAPDGRNPDSLSILVTASRYCSERWRCSRTQPETTAFNSRSEDFAPLSPVVFVLFSSFRDLSPRLTMRTGRFCCMIGCASTQLTRNQSGKRIRRREIFLEFF
jgi:hypothetical protein